MSGSHSGSTVSQSTTSGTPVEGAITYRMKLACGSSIDAVPAPSDLASQQTLCPVHEQLERIEKAEMLGARIWVFVGVYDGLIDGVDVFTDFESAKQAYVKYTDFDYDKRSKTSDITDLHAAGLSEHVDASTIETIDLTLWESAQLFAKLLNDPSTEKVQEFARLLRLGNLVKAADAIKTELGVLESVAEIETDLRRVKDMDPPTLAQLLHVSDEAAQLLQVQLPVARATSIAYVRGVLERHAAEVKEQEEAKA